VYGPWGRPDMSPMLFAKAILAAEPIRVFNHGKMLRDFTYISDIVEGVVRVLRKPAMAHTDFDRSSPNPSISWAPHRIFNIGNSNPLPLLTFISALEQALGIEAIKQFEPMQPGDVEATAADTTSLEEWVGFKPATPIAVGIANFVSWYRQFYAI
ncbi:NAD-dependent epimerase/dehydratase family protein, partial [Synechococcus lacustris]